MRETVSEIRPAIDLAQLQLKWDLACGKEERTEKTLAEVRLEKGRILVEARKAFPRSGPRARGWGELLEKWKIDQQTAWKYMQLAGYVEDMGISEEISQQKREIPTYAEAGIVDDDRGDEDDGRPFVVDLVASSLSEEIKQSDSAPGWMNRLEALAEDMRRHGRALFNAAQELDALCEEHEASIQSPAMATLRSMLGGVRAAVSDTIRLMEGSK